METVEHLKTSRDAQDRCSQWVDHVKDFPVINDLQNERKRRLESESDELFIETDSEFDSVSECGTKKRRLGVKLKSEKFHLQCEWKECNFNAKSVDVFVKHVANHISGLEIKETEETEVYVCSWSGCEFESGIDTEIMRHVNYHAFHSKLKCIGTNVRGRIKLPKCKQSADWKNILESLPPHDCLWQDDCDRRFNNYQYFLYHVQTHVESNPKGNNIAGGVHCLWKECKCKFPSLYKLREHMRAHTKEKVIACPDCGSMFANNTKFHDHCKRQISLEVQGFQCSHCHKFYPTESILRQHMRSHIFHYKCSMCDMSCDSPSSLARHKLYRHTNVRLFPCTLCSHSAKSQKDLDSHLSLHSNAATYVCNVEGCKYSCKNAYTLDRHVEKVHRLEERWYCCHECPMKYKKSYRLTRHLIEAHNLQWLSGHKRFQYILEDDGCYRLQTVRYESIEEGDPLADARAPISNSSDQSRVHKASEMLNYNADSNKNSMPAIQNILISIDEIDEHGNIIDSKVIETQETRELPPSAVIITTKQ